LVSKVVTVSRAAIEADLADLEEWEAMVNNAAIEADLAECKLPHLVAA
jgi:hypothetical protein